MGMNRAAAAEVERLAEHSRRILNAYAAGVNAFIEHNRHNLPIEFTLLRFKPGPWEVRDSIQWAKMMGWNLGGNWESEIVRANRVARLGAARADRLEAGYDPKHPLIIPPGVAYQGINAGMLEQYTALKQLSGFGLLGASNNWVVDGTMTSTGSPILCNDPHLGQVAPSIWYECHLVAGDIDVTGASFPSTPGIVIGHNQHIAWRITNAISYVEDLYIEKFNPQDPHQYEYQGKWEEAQVVREEIKIKGKKVPFIEEVRITRHGPILTSMSGTTTGATADQNATTVPTAELPLALRWTGLEQSRIIAAIHKQNPPSHIEEFRQALREWDDAPSKNIHNGANG